MKSANIVFFEKLNEVISPYAEEVTICRGRVEENLFDAKTVPQEILYCFLDEIGTRFGIGIDLKNLQQFSFQAADKIGYQEDKFMAVYSGGRTKYVEYNIDVKDPHDDYCVNFYIESKTTSVKFYDLSLDSYDKPRLPEGSQLASPFGHGIGEDRQRQDVYFCHHDMEAVVRHFQLPSPGLDVIRSIDNNLNIVKIFGLSFDSSTLKPLKLKRYFYPQDPQMNYILYDEVRE